MARHWSFAGRLLLASAAAALLLVGCSSVQNGAELLPDVDVGTSIVHGQPDGNDHPYVGLVLSLVSPTSGYLCSGTLMSPTVVLTAGHCVSGDDLIGVFMVSFTERPLEQGFVWVTGTAVAHPDFDGYAAFPDTYDIGVVLLDEPVVTSAYGSLPPSGYFDTTSQKELKRARFTPVGYGLQDSAPAPANRPIEDWDMARYRGTQSFITVNSANTGSQTVMLTNNPGFGNGSGGTCSGDSGGPILLEGTNIVTAVNSFGIAPYCEGNDYAFRTDTDVARSFLSTWLSLP